ncbi:hypothetical protein BV25DRAFT_1874835 [Artomyces pyxidatus]|uniref:Uncharacterized protein n=1 Tax=Artomyces pyxidatus TaxID=48021 RepID=A0ACB8TLG3_9AGAM|nr:hypothetical protein BV25DRAFT_1874835 [Artomyces pyxidatus]
MTAYCIFLELLEARVSSVSNHRDFRSRGDHAASSHACSLRVLNVWVGLQDIRSIFQSYLVDTYLMYAASAFAAHTMIRSAVGAAFPLFTFQMFDGMGVNWACTLLGLVSVLMAPMPFLFYKYGARIRESSTFAPCIDLKIGKELEAERRAQEEFGLAKV